MSGRIQLRRATASEWTASNPVLRLGEHGFESDTRASKFGDGSTAWSALPYAGTTFSSGGTPQLVFVGAKGDLPTPSGGVITLADNATYFFIDTVDLTGDRLVCGENTAIIGGSSENCRIKSTGLVGTALITSIYSLPMRSITIEADVALNLDGDGTTTALDWLSVNFTDCGTIGTVKDYANFLMTSCAFLESDGLTIDGTIGTVGFNGCLFNPAASGTAITIAATATISRRFRVIYSSFVIDTGETALNVSTSASIPVEGYILDTINFSGGGTYTTGVQYDDNKALFSNCRGVDNSAEIALYYMLGNATVTSIASAGVAVKIAGTTTAGSINQKFTHTDNRATYTGALARSFIVTTVASVTSAGSAKKVGLYVAKNGTVLPESEIYATTNASNRAESISTQTILELATNDYVEAWIENDTDTTDLTVTELNLITRALN